MPSRVAGLWSFHKFSSSNGLLRTLILIVAVVTLGLGAGSYYSFVSAEVYFVTVATLSLGVAIVGATVATLNKPFAKRKHTKFLDYLVHLYTAWFLLNASLAKLICAGGYQLSDAIVAVRVLSGVFGLLNSGLFFWSAYLSAAVKQSFPCRLSTEVNDFDSEDERSERGMSEGNGKPLFRVSGKKGDGWSFKRACSPQSISQRLHWSVVLDGGLNQLRLLSMVLITVTLSLVAGHYHGEPRDEYVLAVICFNLVVTVILHLLYIIGLSPIADDDIRIFDKSYHMSGGLFLLAGGVLLQGVTLERRDSSTTTRTFAAAFAILTGVLYGYIGWKLPWTITLSGEADKEEEDEGKGHVNGATGNGKVDGEDRMNGKNRKESMVLTQLRPALIFDPGKM